MKIFKNPYLNSIYAELYILILVAGARVFATPNTPDNNFFDPIVALSILVLSVAIMGFLFIGEPLQLYLSGEKKMAVSFFMKTVLGFAILTILSIVLLKIMG